MSSAETQRLGPVDPPKPLTDAEKHTLRLLIQHFVRAFFDTEDTVIYDALIKNDVIKDEELAQRVGSNTKDLGRRIARHANAGLVSQHIQNEQRDANALRSTARKYFYIDYPRFCNRVKWVLAEMHRSIDEASRNELAQKGYICPNCQRVYAMIDALELQTADGFFCLDCHVEVVDNALGNDDKAAGGNPRMTRFNASTETIRNLLRQTDEMIFPPFDAVEWVRKKNRDQHIAEQAKLQASGALPAKTINGRVPGDGLAIAGANGTGAPTSQKVSVEIVDEATSEARRIRKEQEATSKRQQNALPSWYTHSTISGEETAFGLKNGASSSSILSFPDSSSSAPAPLDEEEDVKQDVKVNSDALEHYYESLKAQAAAAALPSLTIDLDDPSLSSFAAPLMTIDPLERPTSTNSKKRAREDDEFLENVDAESLAPPPVPSGQTVMVAGVPKDLNEVTEEDHDLMTPEEYEAYFALI